MNWLSVIAALAVPVLSYIGGVLTFRYTKRDMRSRIEADIALLQLTERADTSGANRLRASIDERLWELANREDPRPYQRRITVVFGGAALMFVLGVVASMMENGFKGPDDSQLNFASYALCILSLIYVVGGLILVKRSGKHRSTRDYSWSPPLLMAPSPAPPRPLPVRRPTLMQRLLRLRT